MSVSSSPLPPPAPSSWPTRRSRSRGIRREEPSAIPAPCPWKGGPGGVNSISPCRASRTRSAWATSGGSRISALRTAAVSRKGTRARTCTYVRSTRERWSLRSPPAHVTMKAPRVQPWLVRRRLHFESYLQLQLRFVAQPKTLQTSIMPYTSHEDVDRVLE